MTVSAGAAKVDITPGAGIAMGGYGARTGMASGVHDPLHVRTLVLSDGTTTLVIAVCDLIGVGPDIVNPAREIIERECGIPAAHVLIGATHTHSGPMNLLSRASEGYTDSTARKIAGSVHMALAAMQPVELKLGTTQISTISQNRRHPDGPIETAARVLTADPLGNAGPTVATLVNYACHATVLEHDNLLYSADFPGAMAELVEHALGGTAIYLQGAAGDINPVWLRHDFEETARIGGIVGAAAVRTAHELRPLGGVQRVVNLSWAEDVEVNPAPGLLLRDASFAATSTTLSLPRRPLPPQAEIAARIKALELELEQVAHDERAVLRRLRPRLVQLRMEYLYAGPDGRPSKDEDVGLQVMRLSDEVALVALPGEFLHDIARDISRDAPVANVLVAGYSISRDAPVANVLVAGYSNGYIGYVPRAEDFPQGGYEVGCARFEPDVAATITEAARAQLVALYEKPPA
jgi:neutral ceramidase